MIHYTYRIDNLINGKYYIGKHSSESLDDGYMGSGTRIKAAIAKYGMGNFKKTILKILPTSEEAFEHEAQIVTLAEVNDPMCYNVQLGGKGRQKQFTDEELRERRSEYKKEYSQRPEVKERQREYDQRPEVKKHRKEYKKEYSQRPEVKERQREYDQQNKGRRLEYQREYCRQNKERHREYMKEYYQQNKERRREYSQRPEVKERQKGYQKKYRRKKNDRRKK